MKQYQIRGVEISEMRVKDIEKSKVLDTSVGGLGGCPYAPGAKGNVATEDVLFMLNGMGITTGVDIEKICKASEYVFEKLGRVPSSRVFNALKSKKKRNI